MNSVLKHLDWPPFCICYFQIDFLIWDHSFFIHIWQISVAKDIIEIRSKNLIIRLIIVNNGRILTYSCDSIESNRNIYLTRYLCNGKLRLICFLCCRIHGHYTTLYATGICYMALAKACISSSKRKFIFLQCTIKDHKIQIYIITCIHEWYRVIDRLLVWAREAKAHRAGNRKRRPVPRLLTMFHLNPSTDKFNHMPSNVWDEISYHFPNVNGCTVEFWGWLNAGTI